MFWNKKKVRYYPIRSYIHNKHFSNSKTACASKQKQIFFGHTIFPIKNKYLFPPKEKKDRLFLPPKLYYPT